MGIGFSYTVIIFTTRKDTYVKYLNKNVFDVFKLLPEIKLILVKLIIIFSSVMVFNFIIIGPKKQKFEH